MLTRILGQAFRRRPRRAAMGILAVAVGTALAGALLAISLDITEKMAREMRSYGANIVVVPEQPGSQLDMGGITIRPPAARGAIDESELVKLKTIFWRHNILGFAPFLSVIVDAGGQEIPLTGTWFDQELILPGRPDARAAAASREQTAVSSTFRTGVRTIAPWWQVDGEWANDSDPMGAMVGRALAERLQVRVGELMTLSYGGRSETVRIVGLVSTGGYEEDQIFVALPLAQRMVGLKSGADKVLVSALVEPDAKLRADLRGVDPQKMTPEQYATWYCSPVMGAIAKQIREVLPGSEVRPIRQIAEAEGAFLNKIGLLMALLTLAALLIAALAVMTTMTATILERRAEIGLMKAIGADVGQIGMIVLSEAALIGLFGGLLGYPASLALADLVGRQVFSTTISPPPIMLPVALSLAIGVALVGSALPVRHAMRLAPITLLRGG